MENFTENATSIFDQEMVKDLIRREIARGHQPAALVLGQQESRSYRAQLNETGERLMEGAYFCGLRVVEVSDRSKLVLAGDKGAWEG